MATLNSRPSHVSSLSSVGHDQCVIHTAELLLPYHKEKSNTSQRVHAQSQKTRQIHFSIKTKWLNDVQGENPVGFSPEFINNITAS